MGAWQADPTGRHQERFHDGATWTARVRDHRVENQDNTGLAAVASPGVRSAPIVRPGPSVSSVPTTARVPTGPPPTGPMVGPPTSMAPLAGTMRTGGPSAAGRRGIPAMLAIAIVLAAFPAVLLVAVGSAAVMAGNDLSSASSDPYSYDETSDFDLGALGADTTERGVMVFAIGGAALVCVILAATGNNAGRAITAIWLVGAAIYLLSQLGDVPSGGEKYAALFVVPPIFAVIGLFTPASSEVFRPAPS